jgi:flagellar motor switch protein FliN/FliY
MANEAGKPGEAVAADPKPASFPTLEGGTAAGAVKNMEFILDIPMQVSVQLGSSKMIVRDLLQLGQGSVIELDKLAGEPMEVFVNNKLVARGEVVVVNEKFGIRLTDVISPMERIQNLS